MTEITLSQIRNHLDKIDEMLIKLISQRQSYMILIAEYKKEHNIPIFHPQRELEKTEEIKKLCKQEKIDEELGEEIIKILFKYAHKEQQKIIN